MHVYVLFLFFFVCLLLLFFWGGVFVFVFGCSLFFVRFGVGFFCCACVFIPLSLIFLPLYVYTFISMVSVSYEFLSVRPRKLGRS